MNQSSTEKSFPAKVIDALAGDWDKPKPATGVVVLPKSIAQFLVHHAFVHLWYMAQDTESGLDRGCCREHCGVCSALYDLHQHPDGDKLSEALSEYCSEGDGWWINGKVDWIAMTAAWVRGGQACHGNWDRSESETPSSSTSETDETD